ncbi:MAG TPA: hypothetical protein VNR20_02715 [Terriglobales bacterium]|nr:hypothetical protein [Terriglobales bacterium]
MSGYRPPVRLVFMMIGAAYLFFEATWRVSIPLVLTGAVIALLLRYKHRDAPISIASPRRKPDDTIVSSSTE